MKTEELIRYYKANIEAIEKGLNNTKHNLYSFFAE